MRYITIEGGTPLRGEVAAGREKQRTAHSGRHAAQRRRVSH